MDRSSALGRKFASRSKLLSLTLYYSSILDYTRQNRKFVSNKFSSKLTQLIHLSASYKMKQSLSSCNLSLTAADETLYRRRDVTHVRRYPEVTKHECLDRSNAEHLTKNFHPFLPALPYLILIERCTNLSYFSADQIDETSKRKNNCSIHVQTSVLQT